MVQGEKESHGEKQTVGESGLGSKRGKKKDMIKLKTADFIARFPVKISAGVI